METHHHQLEITHFPSGAVMIDIRIGNRLWVVQIFEDTIGLSEVAENTGWFDVIPERSFTSTESFKSAFREIL